MRKIVRLNKILPLLLVAALIAAVAPRASRLNYEYKKGSVWNYETLFAPFDFPILKTSEQIQAEMDQVAENHVPYFKYSASATTASVSAVAGMDLGPFKPAVAGSLKNIMEKASFPMTKCPKVQKFFMYRKTSVRRRFPPLKF